MTSKSIELAIFWLPLVAGVLLGGIAGSAWYGGDKIPAIWIAFFGIVCLLLTATLQVQQFVYANVLQPEITLEIINQRFVLKWAPPSEYWFTTRPENAPEMPNGQSQSPTILVQNKSSVAGQDATVTWELAKIENSTLVAASKRLQGHNVHVDSTHVEWGAKLPLTLPTGPNHAFGIAFKQAVQIPFLAKDVETFIPYNVWSEAVLFFIATLPDVPGERSQPIIFTASVKWNIPDGNKGAKFRVTAIATNATTPNSAALVANIDLKAEKFD